MPLELGRYDPGQDARAEGTLFDRRCRLRGRDDLFPAAAVLTGIGVTHVDFDVGLGASQFDLPGDMLADDDALFPTTAAGTFLLRQRMFDQIGRASWGE